jgi:hypothetical protein
MSTELMTILSMVEAALLVVILGTGLTWVAKRLEVISAGLGTLGGALATVESQHLRPLEGLVHKVNPPLQIIVATLPVIAGKARLVVRKATGG